MVIRMLNNNFKNIIFLLLLFVSSAVHAEHEFVKELETGKTVVFIINADEKSKSEQYADWSHYLNEFSSEVADSFVFHKISGVELKKIIKNANNFKENYSMLFMKKGKPSYFYSGPILEPQVYKFVKLKYLNKPIKPKYLNQFSPDEVKIRLRKCG